MLEEGSLADVGLQSKPLSAEVVREGLLVKQGHVRKNWKTRWCVLTRDGMLTYYRPRADRNAFEGPVLGAIFLNGAVLEDHRRMLVLKTSQGKDFPLRPPKGVADNYFRDWKEALHEYTERPFMPATITMATYAPPPPLGSRPSASMGAPHHSSGEELSFSFECRASYRGGTGDKANYLIKSTVSLPSVAAHIQEGSVSRTVKELTQFREQLVRLYPCVVVPPVLSFDVEMFLQRVCSHAVLRYAPELHQFLNLLNTTQMRDRVEFEKRRTKEESFFAAAVASTRGGFFGSNPKFQFTDSIVPKLDEMKQHVAQVSGHLGVVRSHFAQARKHDREAIKTCEAAQKAFKQLGEINSSLHRVTSELVSTLQEVASAQTKAAQETAFEEGLSEYLDFVLPSFDRAIDRRRSLLLAYQLGITKVNNEKMALLEFIRNSSFADPRRSSRVGTDRPTQMKRLEAKVEAVEQSMNSIHEYLDAYSSIFGDEVANYPRWFFSDFRSICWQYVQQQIQYHQVCLNIWTAFLPRIEAVDPTRFENPFEDWWASLPSPPSEMPVSVTLPSVDVRNHPSYRQSSLGMYRGLTAEESRPDPAQAQNKAAASPPASSEPVDRHYEARRSPPPSQAASSSSWSPSQQPERRPEPPRSKEAAQSQQQPSQEPLYSPTPKAGAARQGPPPDEDSEEIIQPVLAYSVAGDASPSGQYTPVVLWTEPDQSGAHDQTLYNSQAPAAAAASSQPLLPQRDDASSPQGGSTWLVAAGSGVHEEPLPPPSAGVDVALDEADSSTPTTTAQTDGGFENSGSSSSDTEEFFSDDGEGGDEDGQASTAAAAASSAPTSPKKATLSPLGTLRNVPGAVPVFRARALFAYAAQEQHQLTLEPGQIVRIEAKHDGGWWSGVDEQSLVRGYLPGSYMEEISNNDDEPASQ